MQKKMRNSERKEKKGGKPARLEGKEPKEGFRSPRTGNYIQKKRRVQTRGARPGGGSRPKATTGEIVELEGLLRGGGEGGPKKKDLVDV